MTARTTAEQREKLREALAKATPSHCLLLVDSTEACTDCGECFSDEEQRAFDPEDNDHCPKCGERGGLTTYYGNPEMQIGECDLTADPGADILDPQVLLADLREKDEAAREWALRIVALARSELDLPAESVIYQASLADRAIDHAASLALSAAIARAEKAEKESAGLRAAWDAFRARESRIIGLQLRAGMEPNPTRALSEALAAEHDAIRLLRAALAKAEAARDEATSKASEARAEIDRLRAKLTEIEHNPAVLDADRVLAGTVKENGMLREQLAKAEAERDEARGVAEARTIRAMAAEERLRALAAAGRSVVWAWGEADMERPSGREKVAARTRSLAALASLLAGEGTEEGA